MQIVLKKVTIRDLCKGYLDRSEEGVTGYSGLLDIRPPYQREFVYKDKQREAVIDTVFKNYPLNVMYWAVRGDGGFEIIDGQQRTISICQFANGDFSFNGRYVHNLQSDEREKFLDYELTIYQCSGTDSEKLAWFRTINIAGEKLTDQELRNAVYSGPWVTAAKTIFSKSNCPAYLLGNKYIDGSPIRQQYLEEVISWMSDGNIEGYMAEHQHDADALAEWRYFQSVIEWIKTNFIVYRSEMKGLPWGEFYNKYKDKEIIPSVYEERISKLMEDDDVTNNRGIYAFVLSNDERHLNLRAFSQSQKRQAYERQKRKCVKCEIEFQIEEMEGDHIKLWSEGGKTIPENCQMLCIGCHREKSRR
jgi:hypothetical protein